MKTLVFVVLLMMMTVNTAFAYDWVKNPINGYHYIAVDCYYWFDAQEQASDLGGNLVTIRNETENEWIKTSFGQFDYIWIGLYPSEDYSPSLGTWVWVSGEPITYTNWAGGDPKPSWPPFVAMAVNSGKWLNISYRVDPGPCEFVGLVEVVPEPASLLGLVSGISILGLLYRRIK